MLVYEKKVENEETGELERKLFGTLENTPSEDDNQLLYMERDGVDEIELVDGDKYFDGGHHDIVRKSDGKFVDVYIQPLEGDNVNIIPGGDFEPVPSEVVSIAISSMPSKTSYLEGEALDLTGIVVEATYEDGDVKEVTGFTSTPAEGTVLEPGACTVEIAFEGQTASFDVEVAEKSLVGIQWTVAPTKVEFKEGEELDLAGAIVDALYDNDTKENVTISCEFTPAEGTELTPDVTSVTASYEGFSAEQVITVEAHVPAEASTDIGDKTFVAGAEEPVEYSVSTVAGDDAGKMVKGYLTYDYADLVSIEYLEVKDGKWYKFKGTEFGPATGFPLSDATSLFRAKFIEGSEGTYSFKVDIKTVEDGEVLCSVEDSVVVEAAPVTTEEALEAITTYVYDDGYTYKGEITTSDNAVSYTIAESEVGEGFKNIMNDFARALGAMYRGTDGKVKTVTFGGTDYTWNVEGTLKGSNYESADGTTLVSVVTAAMAEQIATGSASFDMIVVDNTVTFTVTVTA